LEYISIIMNYVDDKDRKILDLLENNSKLTTNQLSKKTAIPITTIHNRIKKLEKDKIIQKYTLKLDSKRLGFQLSSYILVTFDYHENKKFSQEDAAKKIKSLPNVVSAEIVTGETDLLIKVLATDVEDLNNFIIKKLRNVEGVDKTRTMVVLKEL